MPDPASGRPHEIRAVWGPGLDPIDVAASADDSGEAATAQTAWQVTASRRSAGLPGGTPLSPSDLRGVEMSLYPTFEEAAEHAEAELQRRAAEAAKFARSQQRNSGQMMMPAEDPRQQLAASAPDQALTLDQVYDRLYEGG